MTGNTPRQRNAALAHARRHCAAALPAVLQREHRATFTDSTEPNALIFTITSSDISSTRPTSSVLGCNAASASSSRSGSEQACFVATGQGSSAAC